MFLELLFQLHLFVGLGVALHVFDAEEVGGAGVELEFEVGIGYLGLLEEQHLLVNLEDHVLEEEVGVLAKEGVLELVFGLQLPKETGRVTNVAIEEETQVMGPLEEQVVGVLVVVEGDPVAGEFVGGGVGGLADDLQVEDVLDEGVVLASLHQLEELLVIHQLHTLVLEAAETRLETGEHLLTAPLVQLLDLFADLEEVEAVGQAGDPDVALLVVAERQFGESVGEQEGLADRQTQGQEGQLQLGQQLDQTGQVHFFHSLGLPTHHLFIINVVTLVCIVI